MGADRFGEQASPCEYLTAGLWSWRSLHSGGPLFHHGGVSDGEPYDLDGS